MLFHLYNIFAIYFPSNSFLLRSLFSTIFSFSCFLTSAFTLFSNFATTSFTFSRSSSLFQLSCSAINPFHYTKYFTIPLTFLLFNIFSTFHSLTLFTSTSFTSSALYSPTYFLYHTTQLTFITGWILTKVSNCSLTILVSELQEVDLVLFHFLSISYFPFDLSFLFDFCT